jgi:hypothetical protein
MACEGGEIYVGGTEIADGGGLMLDRKIILIPELLRFLGAAQMLVVDICCGGRRRHRGGCENVVETDF